MVLRVTTAAAAEDVHWPAESQQDEQSTMLRSRILAVKITTTTILSLEVNLLAARSGKLQHSLADLLFIIL
jgi:hypothetical protein